MKLPIYMDYMASTPCDPRVVIKMSECLTLEGNFGNPASSAHCYGVHAAECVAKAKSQIAELIHADPREIIFTSGATESNNLAIKGAALFYQRKGKHIITMQTEHKAVLHTCEYLETIGFEVTYLKPLANGLCDLELLKKTIRDDTILVSIMHVNNEIGVIQDIEKIGHITRERGVIFHSDAAQSVGKINIDMKSWPVDLISLTAHKLYGPKGIGALYVRREPRVRLTAQMHGGGHQQGMRSGTLPTHQIVGMGEAFALAKQDFNEDNARIKVLRDHLWHGISQLGGVQMNGDIALNTANCLNVCFDGVEGESLMLSLRDLALSSGSACSSASSSASHVLKAIGLTDDEASRSIRMSIGRWTTEEEIDYAVQHITEQVQRLRSMSPLWQQTQDALVKKYSE